MKALIQRVSSAFVSIDGEQVGNIDKGLLVFLGVEKGDTGDTVSSMLHKVTHYRVFPDEAGKMNLDVMQASGDLLVVSQFTLAADTSKGLRPGFSAAADSALANALYEQFIAEAVQLVGKVASGRFAADMQVELINDGPVTFLLEA